MASRRSKKSKATKKRKTNTAAASSGTATNPRKKSKNAVQTGAKATRNLLPSRAKSEVIKKKKSKQNEANEAFETNEVATATSGRTPPKQLAAQTTEGTESAQTTEGTEYSRRKVQGRKFLNLPLALKEKWEKLHPKMRRKVRYRWDIRGTLARCKIAESAWDEAWEYFRNIIAPTDEIFDFFKTYDQMQVQHRGHFVREVVRLVKKHMGKMTKMQVCV